MSRISETRTGYEKHKQVIAPHPASPPRHPPGRGDSEKCAFAYIRRHALRIVKIRIWPKPGWPAWYPPEGGWVRRSSQHASCENTDAGPSAGPHTLACIASFRETHVCVYTYIHTSTNRRDTYLAEIGVTTMIPSREGLIEVTQPTSALPKVCVSRNYIKYLAG